MRKIIVDLDGTLTLANTSNYENVSPNLELIEQLKSYHNAGFQIVIATARNMRTYDGNIGKINMLNGFVAKSILNSSLAIKLPLIVPMWELDSDGFLPA